MLFCYLGNISWIFVSFLIEKNNTFTFVFISEDYCTAYCNIFVPKIYRI